jgi:hypothetical protein
MSIYRGSDIEIINRLRHMSSQNHFELLRNIYCLVRDGFRYTHATRMEKTFDIEFVDFEAQNGIYVNQFEVGYMD